MTSSYAPIILFVYNRPDHVRVVWEALSANAEFVQSPIYIYADAAANEDAVSGVEAVRSYVQGLEHPRLHIILRDHNYGIEKNEVDAITTVMEAHGCAIMVEDDIEVGPHFLRYMNLALERYWKDSQVYAISAYSDFSNEFAEQLPEYGFLTIGVAWGWATWKERWVQYTDTIPEEDVEKFSRDHQGRRQYRLGGYEDEMLLTQHRKGSFTWDVIWHWIIFKNQGLVLYHAQPLCNNIGKDGSGVHFNDPNGVADCRDITSMASEDMPDEICITKAYEKAMIQWNLRHTWRYKLGHNPLFNALGMWD